MSLFSNVSSRRWFSGRQRETGSPIALYRFTEWRTEALRNNSCTFDLCRVSHSARENATGTAYFLHGPKSTLIQFRGSVEGKYQRSSLSPFLYHQSSSPITTNCSETSLIFRLVNAGGNACFHTHFPFQPGIIIVRIRIS